MSQIGGEGHGGKQRRTAACLRPTADLLCWHILIHHATASWVRSNEIEIERESLRERRNRKREGPHLAEWIAHLLVHGWLASTCWAVVLYCCSLLLAVLVLGIDIQTLREA